MWRVLCGALLGLTLSGGFVLADIVGAEYVRPVSRYHHDILGDTPEWGGMRLRMDNGQVLEFTLPETHIFEDIAPRLADLDGDGAPEVIAVETSLTAGARLTVWDQDGVRAATPYIGRRNRWLSPIGAADLDGDGKVEIAYIDRPHLARLLRIWRYEDGQLTLVGERDGLTNHRIGDATITSGIRTCAGQPEMITVNRDWSRIMASVFDGTRVTVRDIGRYRGPESLRARLDCS
ncbi:VCBS repeat-containing protein [Thalassovita sp.]|uniref:FG-GAP repeat domain-containing protein n=1 Tax=Thalassovita sp. TaxID=1979401 RepID=UPI002882433D|nr:VCBS repeat-containing protein [Thalassovita sp.]MDF1801964.1 VCBS repeat-containing protein [Thalassovita sp.]